MQITPESKVLVQGITTPWGHYWTGKMKAYGTSVVAGVSAGKGGEVVQDVPVFDLVEEAIAQVGKIDATVIFESPFMVKDAALEAIAAGINQIILASRYVPPSDLVQLLRKAKVKKTSLLGPGSAGIIVPEKFLLGTIEDQFYTPGNIGIISRTDNLTDEIAYNLTQAGLGQSIAVRLGSEGIMGSSFEDWLQILEEDKTTDAIVLIGKPHGEDEQSAIDYISNSVKKPVIAYIAGRNAPSEKPLGDAGIIIATQLSGAVPDTNIAQKKIAAFEKAKIPVASSPSEIPKLLNKVLKKK